ncbi:MAG TPA: ATP-binding protein [Dongiaceae bacterium]|jgi:signal transduction histidine kinase|nr:ATP-binding protein [Dongiaceae bacterium]
MFRDTQNPTFESAAASQNMMHRLVRRLSGIRGKAIAYAAYTLTMTAAACGVWVLGAREYQVRLDRFDHELADVTDSTTMLVTDSIDHVDLLRRQAEAMLAEPAAPASARQLFTALRPSDGFAGYALDHVPEGLRREGFANLTGSGDIPPAESGAGREIQVALALNPLFEATRDQIPDAAWVYYTSKNHFMALYPWAISHDFHWSEDLVGYDFYKMGLPENDPTRHSYWTDVYLDAAGKGLMATVGEPVYDANQQFRGTINLDLTLGTMSRFLASGDFGRGRVLLVNDKNRVIADSADQGKPLGALTDLADLLPDSRSLRVASMPDGDQPGTFRNHGGWLLQTAIVGGAPWRLLMIVDRGALLLDVVRSIWIGFAGLFALGTALVAFEQRRRATAALVENVDALQTMTLTLANARDEAQQANRTKSMLLANVSHELRTPLNAIIGFSDLMRHEIYGPLGNERYAEYAADIERSGKMLLSLINDLLDVTKLEAGRHELVESSCDLAALVEEAVGLVKMQAGKGDVTLQTRIDATMPEVTADERALRQITLNLLSNAVKFTPAGGTVKACCGLNAKGQPTIVVKDTGRGIPAEEMKNLFRPFARAAEAKRASTPGTGLGLAIVKSLVELHQGTIAMESKVGQGTTVTVTLPAERVIAAPGQEAA